MTDREQDRDALEAARKAVDQAKAANVDADATNLEIHRSSHGIRVIVERNGYVDRFRQMLRGA